MRKKLIILIVVILIVFISFFSIRLPTMGKVQDIASGKPIQDVKIERTTSLEFLIGDPNGGHHAYKTITEVSQTNKNGFFIFGFKS